MGSIESISAGDSKVADVQFPLSQQKARYIKLTAKRYGVIPAGQQGEGHEAWLFVDEVVVD
ncbi:MAG: hypothetical protein IPN76_34150 [Saprospiraceae bacterium]|nr:hypothetical protein [Saprospiraceae bacterium]